MGLYLEGDSQPLLYVLTLTFTSMLMQICTLKRLRGCQRQPYTFDMCMDLAEVYAAAACRQDFRKPF